MYDLALHWNEGPEILEWTGSYEALQLIFEYGEWIYIRMNKLKNKKEQSNNNKKTLKREKNHRLEVACEPQRPKIVSLDPRCFNQLEPGRPSLYRYHLSNVTKWRAGKEYHMNLLGWSWWKREAGRHWRWSWLCTLATSFPGSLFLDPGNEVGMLTGHYVSDCKGPHYLFWYSDWYVWI